MPHTQTEGEVLTLPDFHSYSETSDFVAFLEDHIDRYAYKTLHYHSEMIRNHLERIQHHIICAEKLVIRANGDITDNQKRFYKARKVETVARKFYNSMSDVALDRAYVKEGYATLGSDVSREVKVNILIKTHVEKELCAEVE